MVTMYFILVDNGLVELKIYYITNLYYHFGLMNQHILMVLIIFNLKNGYLTKMKMKNIIQSNI